MRHLHERKKNFCFMKIHKIGCYTESKIGYPSQFLNVGVEIYQQIQNKLLPPLKKLYFYQL